MKSRNLFGKLSGIAAVSAALLLASGPASAHCDGLDGPVAKTAFEALDAGNVNQVLIWVQKNDEADIKHAFEHALNVRNLGPAAKELADRYFLETLVRVHRAGEGAPYTGLKPAGRDLGPAIPAADRAIETGSAEPVLKLLTEAVRKGLHEQFHGVTATKEFATNDVAAGRKHVAAYVEYVHYVERLYDAAGKAAQGHAPEPAKAAAHAH
ncbi:MAG: hypothetical protein A3G81_15745 [Betaproteobacteria bacterium RIFCSPLOWO2_12_FULL_65_14]|nr:MAG: hypothetical protein A3G81_15745 [Betaproteobacteria bacterium RIFCSPLOWO2_12_FULL_65_14]